MPQIFSIIFSIHLQATQRHHSVIIMQTVIQKSPSSLCLNTNACAFYNLANCYFYQKSKISAYKFILNPFLFQNQLHFYQISEKFICDLSTMSRKLLSHYDATQRIVEMHVFPSWQFIKLCSTHFAHFNSLMGITPFFRPNHRKLLNKTIRRKIKW